MVKNEQKTHKEDKGNILYVGGFMLPDKNAAAHRVLNNAKIFRKLGYGVAFIDTNRELSWDDPILATLRNVEGFRCYSQPYPNGFKELVESNISIRKIIEVVNDVGSVKAIICYNYQSIPMLMLKSFCLNNNIKLVSDCTEGYSKHLPISPIAFVKNTDDFMRMKYVQKKVDGLILISEKLLDYYSDHNIKVLLPPLIDLNENKWAPNLNAQKSDILKFVYAGNIGTRKDKLDLIVRSIINYAGPMKLQLTVVGVTKEQFKQKYSEMSIDLNMLDERVLFKGRLQHSEALKWVKDADFYIFYRDVDFTTNIGFPTKLVESFGCGTPVITNSYSDVNKYIINNNNGFIISLENVEEDFLAILDLGLEHLKGLKRNVDRNIFNYENHIDQTRDFFANLIK